MSEATAVKSDPEAICSTVTSTEDPGTAPTLGKLFETGENLDKPGGEVKQGAESTKKCPFFGVRSYLHNFYEKSEAKDASLYESDEYAFLLKPAPSKYRYCRPIAWKATVWIGINFIIFGIIGIFVSYLVPAKAAVIAETSDTVKLDREVKNYNDNLEIVKIVGLLLFCVGGALTIGGLLVPTILYKYFCDDELWTSKGDGSGSRKVSKSKKTSSVSSQEAGKSKQQPDVAVASPLNPANISTTTVQPDRVKPESVVTQEGLQGITTNK